MVTKPMATNGAGRRTKAVVAVLVVYCSVHAPMARAVRPEDSRGSLGVDLIRQHTVSRARTIADSLAELGSANNTALLREVASATRVLEGRGRDHGQVNTLLIDNDPRYTKNFRFLLQEGEAGTRIIGGVPTRKYSDVVAIQPPLGSGSGGRLCTGVLIAPNVVLTAGHCECEGINGRVKPGWSIRMQVRTFRVKQIDTRVRFACPRDGKVTNDLVRGRDFAILFLDAPIPASVATPRRIASKDMVSPRRLRSVRAVGFGRDEDGWTGEKRHVDIAVVSPACGSGNDARDYRCQVGAEIVAQSPRFYEDTCNGDSGGPIYVYDEMSDHYYLAGITSRGIANGRCGDGGIYGLADETLVGWISQSGVSVQIGRGGARH